MLSRGSRGGCFDNAGVTPKTYCERLGYSVTPTSGSPTTYSYDQAGRLTSITPPTGTSAGYTYDGNGLLASETTSSATSHFAWDEESSLPLLLADGQNSYIYGPDGTPVEQIDSSGNPTYLHHDQLGSTRLISDENGNSTGTFTYNPYGTLAGRTGSTGSATSRCSGRFGGEFHLGRGMRVPLQQR